MGKLTLEHENQHDVNGYPSNKIYFASGELDESAAIKSGVCVVGGIIVYTDGTNDAVCTVYDNTEASGKIAGRALVKGSDNWGGVVIPFRIANGIYATITGTGAKYQIYYL